MAINSAAIVIGSLLKSVFKNKSERPLALRIFKFKLLIGVIKRAKDKIINMVEEGHSGSCYMYYNKFKNAMTQILQKQQILPVKKTSDKERDVISEYEYEGENLVHDVINLYFSGLVKYALLQSKASEEGARMTAMDNATRNAADLIDKLTLKLNRSRQAIITTELTEIISGAEAL
ncbi:MAG: F0F1 ATP synthase subunit gamma [Rickettsiaceae bacterium]|nr:F0F1 ATP synthase subunit gamma [Rickettsiaceae bacterium]